MGLSPRVRGNLGQGVDQGEPGGTIPACAGEPGARATSSTPETDYPRVCGGTARVATANAPESGLSPRVRGNPGPSAYERRRVGTIPACAGEPATGRAGV